jgi:hypothetical protein
MTEKRREKYEDAHRAKLLTELSRHVGEINAIGMAELYEAVFGTTWRHRINDTKKLRELVTEMRNEGIPICSVPSCTGGGYFLASAGSELKSYTERDKRRALRILARVSRIEKISLPELLGQMRLRMEGCDANELA